MKEYLKKLPQDIQELILLAGGIADRRGMPAYVVGGFVRDLILGAENLDLDILVEGDGISFAEEFAGALLAGLVCHKRFGTATVSLRSRIKVDIASARKESYPEPAALPVVTAAKVKDDLCRRDFTINAMAVGINKTGFGALIDFFGGKKDLRLKKVRVLHDLSFIDDPTRILRAVRFEQRYNFKIEPQTLKLLKEAARLNMLHKVQPQRIRDELILILKEPRAIRQVRRLKGLAGLGFIHPGLSVSPRVAGLFSSAERQINWLKQNFPRRRHLDAWLIYFLALTEALDIEGVRQICRKLVFRRGEEKRMLDYKRAGSRLLGQLSRAGLKPAAVFHLLEPLAYEVILALKVRSKDRLVQKRIADFFAGYNGTRIYVSGEDLKNLGFSPGPAYQNIFRKILDARLNGRVRTKEEELALARKLI